MASLTLLHSERPKLYGVLAVLSAIGLNFTDYFSIKTVVENIVEIMEELKYESEDLYDTDGDVDQDDSTLMADR